MPQSGKPELDINAPLHILHLEDDPVFSELMSGLLEKDGIRAELTLVDNLELFEQQLKKPSFDVILADYQLPACTGLQALAVAQRVRPGVPLILISGVIGEEEAIESLKSGATDYVLKTSLGRLMPAIRRAVAEAQERKRAAEELSKTQGELVHTSRLAGMAEVATSVLHNVGNVLNSVNVSVTLISDELKKSGIANLSRVAAWMEEHAADLGDFITKDSRGRQLPEYLKQLSEHLARQQTSLLEEMNHIRDNLDHIKEIVAIQQNYSTIAGVLEKLNVTNLVEDALRLNAGALTRHDIQIVREYGAALPEITVDKHKVLQILVNLIRNAKYACDESGRDDKRLTLRITGAVNGVCLDVIDNGVGIPAGNLARLFEYGFTTRKSGHGFGLHSSLLAAKAMGGTLAGHSDGPGLGSRFTLELPLQPAKLQEA
jgi:signal transduction histidine kinase